MGIMLASDIPTNPRSRRSWIIYQLSLIDSSLSKIAQTVGLTRAHASKSALGGQSKRFEREIAQELSIAVQKLFPELYDGAGRRIPPKDRNTNTRHGDRRVEKRQVA